MDKTPKIMDNFSDMLSLEGARGQTDDTSICIGDQTSFWRKVLTLFWLP